MLKKKTLIFLVFLPPSNYQLHALELYAHQNPNTTAWGKQPNHPGPRRQKISKTFSPRDKFTRQTHVMRFLQCT